MIMVSDLMDILQKVDTQQQNLLSIYRDEIKEYGIAKENTIRLSNALIFAIERAYKELEKGLKGEF